MLKKMGFGELGDTYRQAAHMQCSLSAMNSAMAGIESGKASQLHVMVTCENGDHFEFAMANQAFGNSYDKHIRIPLSSGRIMDVIHDDLAQCIRQMSLDMDATLPRVEVPDDDGIDPVEFEQDDVEGPLT